MIARDERRPQVGFASALGCSALAPEVSAREELRRNGVGALWAGRPLVGEGGIGMLVVTVAGRVGCAVGSGGKEGG